MPQTESPMICQCAALVDFICMGGHLRRADYMPGNTVTWPAPVVPLALAAIIIDVMWSIKHLLSD